MGPKPRAPRDEETTALDDKAEHIRGLERRIEVVHGKRALREARSLADAREALFVQKLHHEYKKVATAFQFAIADLRAEAQQERPDSARQLDLAERMTSLGRLRLSVVTTACDLDDGLPPKHQPESLREVVDEAVRLLFDRTPNAFRLAVAIAIDEALTVQADRGKLLQAFSNVLQNALEAYPDAERAPIHVSAHVEKGGAAVRLSFRDEGCGIRREELPHVFAPFASTKPGIRGLGLLNVKRMIESAHGGEVQVESERGVGTTVHLVLPVEQTL
jgi:signal transduction histidine kinase